MRAGRAFGPPGTLIGAKPAGRIPRPRAWPFSAAGGQERDGLRDDLRVAQDAIVAEAGRIDESRSGPRLRDRRRIVPRNFRIGWIVEDEQRRSCVTRER